MAASDYTGLTARWMDALATDSTDTDFAARLPALIGDSELRCLRDLDPVAVRKNNQVQAFTPGSPALTLPADCWIPRRLVLQQGTSRTTLLQRQLSFLEEYQTDSATTGTPKYWTMPADGALQVAPTPTVGATFTLRLDYTYRPATMTLANPTTWLSINYPDLLYYAGMIWLAGWTKSYASGDDPKMAGYWTNEYQTALGIAKLEEALKKGIPPMEVGPTQPIPATGG